MWETAYGTNRVPIEDPKACMKEVKGEDAIGWLVPSAEFGILYIYIYIYVAIATE